MSIENTTADAPAATLNENELFENFVRGEVKIDALGGMPVMHILSGFDMPGLDEAFEDEIERLFDENYHNSPNARLDDILREFEGICHILRAVIFAFNNFKASHVIYSGDDDEAARYHVPTFEGEAA